MFEPLAASVLTSVLPSRLLVSQLLSSKPAFGMVVRTAQHHLPPDFFTPHPWSAQVKGKGKALAEDDYLSCNCSSGEGCPASHNGVIQSAAASMTSLNSPRHRTRRSSGHKDIASGSASHIPPLHAWIGQVNVAQRRHASSRTAVEHTTPFPEQRQVWLRTFMLVAEGAEAFSAEDAWLAFGSLCDCMGHPPGSSSAAVAFVSNITRSIASGRQGPLSSEFLHLWGTRIQDMLHHIDPGIQDMADRVRCDTLLIAASAMSGELDEAAAAARAALHSVDSAHPLQQADVLQTYAVVVQALRQHQGPRAVLRLLTQESDSLDVYLCEHPPWFWSDARLASVSALFSSIALDSFSGVENPVEWLREALPLYSKEQRSVAGLVVVRALSRAQRPVEAHAVMRSLQRQAVVLSDEATLLVSQSFVRANLHDEANALFSTITPATPGSPRFREYHHIGLFLRSRQGDTEQAQQHYDQIKQHDRIRSSDIATLMHAYATAGKPATVVKLFNKFFYRRPSLPRPCFPPNIVHYTTVLYALARVGDLDGLDLWLRRFSQAGHRPDHHVYSVILQSFASRSDLQSMSTVIAQMRESGLAMTPVFYTTLISTLAKRGDPIAAERLFRRAVEDGVKPDLPMVTAIMNAHVEAGSWQGVIRAFDYLNTPGRLDAGMTIEVFNTLMKAYVLIGAPFRLVANLFRQLESVKLRPDSRTFALLVQSACDSGFMDIAQELVEEMERLVEEDDRASLKVNIYVLTIILSGYLRQRKRIKAKEVLDRIHALGFQASAVTYAAILKAYCGQKSEEGKKVAEDFLQSLTEARDADTWLQTVRGRRNTLETLYLPLLHAHAFEGNPDEVVRIHEKMVKARAQPSLGTMTVLLDAYRRAENVTAVQALWPEIYRLALEFTRQTALLSPDEDDAPQLGAYSTLLCVPFSILIDALSTAGKHAEVAQAWRALKDAGLQFDSHNWNHLAVALVRAGEPQRAFDIVENVILRYQHEGRQQLIHERDRHPASPLTLDLPLPDEGDLPPHRSEAPLHSPDRRSDTAELTMRRLRSYPSVEESGAEDFAHPLHLLDRMSPVWHVWRPHGATLVLLGQVLTHLRSGRLVQPLGPGVDQDPKQTAITMEEVRKRTEAAGRVLGEIYDRFPETVQLVHEYELMRRSSSRLNTSRR